MLWTSLQDRRILGYRVDRKTFSQRSRGRLVSTHEIAAVRSGERKTSLVCHKTWLGCG